MTSRSIALISLTVLALVPRAASAQIENCTYFKTRIDAIVSGAPAAPGQDRAVELLDVGAGTRCFAAYLGEVDKTIFQDFVRRLEASRTDKQSGASANANASTSVVSQGPVAKALSVAVEYGALTQSVSGQVVTLRGNAAGIPSALVQHNLFPYCVGDERTNQYCVRDSLLSILRHASFAVSFDATRNGAVTATASSPATTAAGQPVTFTADRRQISMASVHIELWNQRDTSSQAFRDKWAEQVGTVMNTAAGQLLTTAGGFFTSITSLPEHKMWLARHLPTVRAAGRDHDKLVTALNDALRDLRAIARANVPDLAAQSSAALEAYDRYFLAQSELIDTLAKKTVFALEYTANRPNGQPKTSNAKLIADWPVTTQTKLVGNAGATWYDSLPAGAPAGMSKYRDAQAGFQLDQGLGSASILGPATFSLAVYYQYQHAPALFDVDPANPIPGVQFVALPDAAKTVFAEKGNIVLGQAKLTLTPQGSAMKIPVAVTISNRTELIDKTTWRAQVGITYDFDSLFALANRARP
jgi:hypothetical protein